MVFAPECMSSKDMGQLGIKIKRDNSITSHNLGGQAKSSYGARTLVESRLPQRPLRVYSGHFKNANK